MKTGAAGGGWSTKQKTYREDTIGGERVCARENCIEVHWICTGGQETQVNLEGGIGEGPEPYFEDGKLSTINKIGDRVYCPYGRCSGFGNPPPYIEHVMGL